MSVPANPSNDEIFEFGKCQMCKKNPSEELHSCPYAEDINGDSETLCDCCHEYSRQCAEDI